MDLDGARERFLGGDGLPAAGVRAAIAASWERSRRAGLDASRFRVPFVDDLEFDGRLASCARPVLDDLAGSLAGTPVAVILTDAQGHLLDRRVGEPGWRRRLDDISLAPGFSYAERFAGTNGVGTALADGAPSLVVGAEHFTDRLQPFACAGAPILGLDGTPVGVLDVTCPREHAGDLLRVLALRAARDTSRALCERGSGGARAVMAAFRAACAGHTGPVLAVSLPGAGADDFVVANGAARRELGTADREALAGRALERLAHGGSAASAEERALLADGPVRLLFTPVPPQRPAGTVVAVVRSTSTLRLAPGQAGQGDGRQGSTPTGERSSTRQDGGTRPLSGLAGTSPTWRSVGAALRAAAADRRAVLVVGEPGVGKSAAVRAVHRERRPSARWVVVDVVDRSDPDTPAASPTGPTRSAGGAHPFAALATLPAALGERPATVVLRGLDTADPAIDDALAALLEDVPATWWVVGIASGDPEDLRGRGVVGTHFPAVVAVEPLRRRPEDVVPIATLLLARLAPPRRARCSAETEALLTGARWPGNAHELGEVLRSALAASVARASGVVEPVDLPDGVGARGTRRRLSPLEVAERDLIVSALVEAGGNRVAAAAALGIGRTTLYRRLRAFGLTDVGR